MSLNPRPLILLAILAYVLSLVARFQPPSTATAGLDEERFWHVEELHPGMKGYGRTVLPGTQIESFQVEVLAILETTRPSRHLLLCRLSGLDLTKTGGIARVSGSPVYIHGRLVGGIDCACASGKEPIAGITLFAELANTPGNPTKSSWRVSLDHPMRLGNREYAAVTVAQPGETPREDDSFWLVPLQPLASTTNPPPVAVTRGRLGVSLHALVRGKNP